MNRLLKHSTSMLYILVFMACGTNVDPPEIKALPEGFSLVFPSNNDICQAGDLIANEPNKLGVSMQWEKSKNATSYELSVTDMETGAEEVSLKTNTIGADVVLTKATLYQWKITAINDHGENESAQWSFYTKGNGVGNHVPYPAYDFSFTIATASNMLSVSWKASDEDEDPLSYDVKVLENDIVISTHSDYLDQSLADIEVSIGATYHLIVTVKDGISETTTRSPNFTHN